VQQNPALFFIECNSTSLLPPSALSRPRRNMTRVPDWRAPRYKYALPSGCYFTSR